MPLVAWHTPADVQGFDIPFNGTCNETRSRIFRRGYYASVAYTDYNIGMLIDTLDELQVAAETVVVVFGDHGWQLGEHDLWAKMSMFEAATHIPFIMRAPWMTESVGKVTWAFTEMVSRQLFPGFGSDSQTEVRLLDRSMCIPLWRRWQGCQTRSPRASTSTGPPWCRCSKTPGQASRRRRLVNLRSVGSSVRTRAAPKLSPSRNGRARTTGMTSGRTTRASKRPSWAIRFALRVGAVRAHPRASMLLFADH